MSTAHYSTPLYSKEPVFQWIEEVAEAFEVIGEVLVSEAVETMDSVRGFLELLDPGFPGPLLLEVASVIVMVIIIIVLVMVEAMTVIEAGAGGAALGETEDTTMTEDGDVEVSEAEGGPGEAGPGPGGRGGVT